LISSKFQGRVKILAYRQTWKRKLDREDGITSAQALKKRLKLLVEQSKQSLQSRMCTEVWQIEVKKRSDIVCGSGEAGSPEISMGSLTLGFLH
jgi:hypothetical protein